MLASKCEMFDTRSAALNCSVLNAKLQIKRHICVMEYFLCLNFYKNTMITLLLVC